MPNSLIALGTIIQTYQLQGGLILQLSQALNDTPSLQFLFLRQSDTQYIPYYITHIRQQSPQRLCIYLEDIDSREKARPFVHQPLYIPKTVWTELYPKMPALTWEHYDIQDEQGQIIGVIEDIITTAAHPIARVRQGGKIHLIPLHPDWILQVHPKQQYIQMTLPEGLLDL